MAEDVEAVKEQNELHTTVHHRGSHDIVVTCSPPMNENGNTGEMAEISRHGHRLSNDTGASPSNRGIHRQQSDTVDAGGRRRIARMLTKVGNTFGTASPNRFDDSEFKRGKALDFPEIPGEEGRNSALGHIRDIYNLPRDADGNATPDRRSRAGSFTGSVSSGIGVASSSRPRPDLHLTTSGGTDRLEVPSPVHLSGARNPHLHSTASFTVPPSPSSPAVVVSSDNDVQHSLDVPKVKTPQDPG